MSFSDEIGTLNPDFVYLQYHGDIMGLRKFEQGFSSFFAIFDDFSKWSMPKPLGNFGKSSNMAKNVEKPCSTCLNPIFWLGTRQLDFGYPFCHYVI